MTRPVLLLLFLLQGGRLLLLLLLGLIRTIWRLNAVR